jgi:hypothetical protein
MGNFQNVFTDTSIRSNGDIDEIFEIMEAKILSTFFLFYEQLEK